VTNATVDRYLAFWNAPTSEAGHRLATDVFTEDVSYSAPIAVLSGADQLIDFREQLVGHIGAVNLDAREQPETHHDRVRLKWEIRLADGESFATGTDVIVLASDGRISSITAFLDRAPEGFDPHAHN
jgi:ketosteroid isomerase-like protein